MSTVKGVYVLIISISRNIKANIGALSSVNFEKGFYAYVGSAQNGLEKRVERHLRKAKRKFWHIDYLLDNYAVKVSRVFYKKAGKNEECKIAERISETGVLVKSFGSSDCKCQSHLTRIADYGLLKDLMKKQGWQVIKRSNTRPSSPLEKKRKKQ